MTLLAFLVLQCEKPAATIKLDAPSAVVGKPIHGVLTLTIPAGQHGYQNPPVDPYENPIKLSVIEVGFRLGKVDYPKGTELNVAGAEKPSRVYQGTVTIPFSLVPTKPSPKGAVTNVNFKVDYQLCTMSSCYPPASLVAKAPLKVAAALKKAKA